MDQFGYIFWNLAFTVSQLHDKSLIKVTKFVSKPIMGDPNLAYFLGFLSSMPYIFHCILAHGTVHGNVPFSKLTYKIEANNSYLPSK